MLGSRKRIALLLCGLAVVAVIPVLALVATPQSEVIATASDEYLNDPDTVFNISSGDLLSQMFGGDKPVVLSTRARADFARGHIAGAINIPFSELFRTSSLSRLPDDRKIIVSCYTGHTGSMAAALLNVCGYDSTNLTWGIMGWTDDAAIATTEFVDPTTDLPIEVDANDTTTTHDQPVVAATYSSMKSEVLRAACAAYAEDGGKFINASDLHELIAGENGDALPLVISVRTAEKYAVGHIPGAIHIPIKEIATQENLQKLDSSRMIITYSDTGRLGGQAAAILSILGYDVYNLLWGMSGWTTDPAAAPERFDRAASPDYPVKESEGAAPAPVEDSGGGCGG